MFRIVPVLFFFSALFAADAPKFSIDDAGRWSLPLRYWSHSTPYESAGSFAFLTEVIKLGPEVPPINQQELPLRFRTGTVKVHELLHPKADKLPELARVRELVIEGTDGLNVGDRVIVFVDPEPYEGGYVINFHEGGCHVGIRLPPPDDLTFGEESQKHLIKSLRQSRTTLRQFSSEELSAWIAVDAVGIARGFQMELEMERLHWKERTK